MKQLLLYFLLFIVQSNFGQINSKEDKLGLRINIQNKELITVNLINFSNEKINYYGEKPVIQFYYKGEWKFSSLYIIENKKCVNDILKESRHVKPYGTKSFNFRIPKGNYKIKTRFFINSFTDQKEIYSKEIITSIDKAILENI